MAEIDGDLRNRQYHVEQLAAMNVSDVKFTRLNINCRRLCQ